MRFVIYLDTLLLVAWKAPYIFRYDCYVSKKYASFYTCPSSSGMYICYHSPIGLLLGTVIQCVGPDRCLESETFTLICTRSLDTALQSRIRIMSEDGTAMG